MAQTEPKDFQKLSNLPWVSVQNRSLDQKTERATALLGSEPPSGRRQQEDSIVETQDVSLQPDHAAEADGEYWRMTAQSRWRRSYGTGNPVGGNE